MVPVGTPVYFAGAEHLPYAWKHVMTLSNASQDGICFSSRFFPMTLHCFQVNNKGQASAQSKWRNITLAPGKRASTPEELQYLTNRYKRDWGNMTTEFINLQDSSITQELWSMEDCTMVSLFGSLKGGYKWLAGSEVKTSELLWKVLRKNQNNQGNENVTMHLPVYNHITAFPGRTQGCFFHPGNEEHNEGGLGIFRSSTETVLCRLVFGVRF